MFNALRWTYALILIHDPVGQASQTACGRTSGALIEADLALLINTIFESPIRANAVWKINSIPVAARALAIQRAGLAIIGAFLAVPRDLNESILARARRRVHSICKTTKANRGSRSCARATLWATLKTVWGIVFNISDPTLAGRSNSLRWTRCA